MRNVIKINIEQEQICIQDDREYIPFLVLDGEPRKIFSEDELSPAEAVNFKQELFRVFQATDSYSGSRRNYLLKVDEEKLFNDLLMINKGSFEEVKRKACNKANREGKYHGRLEGEEHGIKIAIARVKKIAWWKRLFKKF